MKKTNWIILKSKDRGIDYGVGTFIKQLSSELAKQKHLYVFILEIGLTQNGNYEQLIQSARNFSANISYLGFIPFEDVVALYHEADVVVIPSFEEQCSYVALEMLHSGLPAVASNLGRLKEIFIHKENALLAGTLEDKNNIYGIAPNVEEFENQIYLLLTNKDLRKKFARKAKERSNGMFTTQIMVNNYLRFIENLKQNP